MKKFMLFAAMASVVLTSCVNEDKEAMEVASKKAISFDMPVMKPTRLAGEVDGTIYPTGESFKVFCKSYTGTYTDWTTYADYFHPAGETVALTGGNWSTTTVHYWPELGNKLAFAAYSPATASAHGTFAQTQTGLTITGFSTQDAVANQYDLMYTPRVIDLDKNDADDPVSLVFKHALTSVVFKATKTDADATYTIKSLSVNGKISTTGNFNQNIPNAAGTDGIASWTPAAATDKTYSILTSKTIDVAQDPGTNLTGVGSTASATTALLLIPQGVDANTTVTITYNKKTGSNSLDATATIKLSDFKAGGASITEWLMGNRYIYNIKFGANKPIYFDPSVDEDWNDVNLEYTIE